MKQLALGSPLSRRSWQERKTGTRESWCFHHFSWSTELVRQQLERLRSSLWREPRTSFPPPPSPCPMSLRLWGSLGKPWWPRLNMRWWIFISKCWFMRVTFGWVLLAQKTLCNGTINIVSKVSLNFGCLFLRNNTVLLDGRHGCRLKRWIWSDYISILSQH